MRVVSPDPEATRRAAAALAECVGAEGLAIGLIGPLGAGKTVFAKGLAEGWGVAPGDVASPTFVIASEYACADGRRLAHVDCYRVESEEELLAAGFLDLLAPGTLLAVEWSDRFPGALPADHLDVRLDRSGAGGAGEGVATRRVLHAVAFGTRSQAILTAWARRLEEVASVEVALSEEERDAHSPTESSRGVS